MSIGDDKQAKKSRKEETFEQYKERTTDNVQALFSGSSGASHSIQEQSVGEDIAQRPQPHSGPSSGAQPTVAGMGSIWTKDLHDGARSVIANWFYACAIPHHAAEHPLFQKCFDAALAAGKGFKVPTRYQLSGNLLDQCVKDIDSLVESHRDTWRRYGCSLMADGWTTQRGNTLINFLVASERGTLFLRSIDASSHVKKADYIVDLYEEIIAEIGAEHIVQIISDNAANFKKAGEILMERYPKIYWTPCAAHCIDLLLEDIGEVPRFKEVIANAKRVGKFIYNHTIVLNLVRQHIEGKDLVRPGATHFATHFLTLRSLDKYRLQLMQAFGSQEWLHGDAFSRFRIMPEGIRVAELVYDLQFWSKVVEAVRVVLPSFGERYLSTILFESIRKECENMQPEA